MTKCGHLEFYDQAKEVKMIRQDVTTVRSKVSLKMYESCLASNILGGNKRKLSLAITLIDNLTILVLDKTSSSTTAASKCIMQKTLAEVTTGRSLILTRDSMVEADVLVTRTAIVFKRILVLSTTDFLRKEIVILNDIVARKYEQKKSGIGALLKLLKDNVYMMGLGFYSIWATILDPVLSNVVTKNIREKAYTTNGKKSTRWGCF